LTSEGDEVVEYDDNSKIRKNAVTLNPISDWVKAQGQYGLLALAEILFGRNMIPIESKLHQLNDEVGTGKTSLDEGILTLTALPEYQMH
jgi:hypothetical protein